MFDRVNDHGIKSILFAQEEAHSLGHPRVDTEHLLLGLLSSETGIAAESLKSAGVMLEETRARLKKNSDRWPSISMAAEVPFAPDVNNVLELAWETARKLKQVNIGNEHILIGVIDGGTGLAVNMLTEFGVDLQGLRQNTIQRIEEASITIQAASRTEEPEQPSNRLQLLASLTDNVMRWSRSIGEGLLATVQIAGHSLRATRCLIVCADDSGDVGKSYEYWYPGEAQNCGDLGWPKSGSLLLAQTELTGASLVVIAESSDSSPLQEELRFIGAESFIAIALRSQQCLHGYFILQQCDYPRVWEAHEIAWIEKISKVLAHSLSRRNSA
jgi:Clp amino terminal domain, pathogenicity island component